jgi:hypothetical protein
MDRRILTDAQIDAIITSERVLEAKDRLATSNTVRFTMDLPMEIKAVLQDSLGLDLPEQVPLRWIQGDTPSHIDAGSSTFERTHLVYLTDSDGEFHLGEETFPICKGESFVFPHGTLHGTSHTGTTPRLMLGPMSEHAEPVGAPLSNGIYYCTTQTNALAGIIYVNDPGNFTISAPGPVGGYIDWRISSNSTGTSSQAGTYNENDVLISDGVYYLYPEDRVNGTYYSETENDALAGITFYYNPGQFTILPPGTVGGYFDWRITSNSTGTSSQAGTYNQNDVLISDGIYYLYPEGIVCFGKGSMIQCEGGSIPVEELKVGTKVKTLKHGYKAVTLLGTSVIRNRADSERVRERLYIYPKENLILTGGHSVLLDEVSGTQLERIKESFGNLFFTEGKIRLMAMDDDEAEPYLKKGPFPIYNFVLEAPNDHTNYGVFANGKLVESSFPYWVKKMNAM